MAKRIQQSKISSAVAHPEHEREYSGLLSGIKITFTESLTTGEKLFTTDVNGLWKIYLDNLPSNRQVHNCHECKHFVERFGGLVTIDETGTTRSVMWEPKNHPGFYQDSFGGMQRAVERARITGVFLSDKKIWGTPVTGEWTHMSVVPVRGLVYQDGVLTPSQVMAWKVENYKTVANALVEFPAPVLDQALRMFNADALVRSEKFRAPVTWLRGLHERGKGRKGENLLWRAIASAPEGFCHPKSSVIGPLLDDVKAGLPFDDINRKFSAMLHPLAYQRPKAAPTQGNIVQAEALVDKLGLGKSLERRFARLDELELVWKPRPVPPINGSGVFGHLQAKSKVSAIKPVELPSQVMTWGKFSRLVLPWAEEVEFMVPYQGNFMGHLTALDLDAPPVIKWDREDRRNPVSTYVYNGGSLASTWNLQVGWTKVTGIALVPNLWVGAEMNHLGEGVNLALEGAVDTKTGQGNALFPEILRGELHQVRATIEAFSRKATIHGKEEASACGYSITKTACRIELRVRSAGTEWTRYKIDRWD